MVIIILLIRSINHFDIVAEKIQRRHRGFLWSSFFRMDIILFLLVDTVFVHPSKLLVHPVKLLVHPTF